VKLTREQIERYKRDVENGYAVGGDEINALCDMALSTLDAEPVAPGTLVKA